MVPGLGRAVDVSGQELRLSQEKENEMNSRNEEHLNAKRGATSQERSPDQERPPYEPPRLRTYTEEELLNELGPAQTGGYINPFGEDIL